MKYMNISLALLMSLAFSHTPHKSIAEPSAQNEKRDFCGTEICEAVNYSFFIVDSNADQVFDFVENISGEKIEVSRLPSKPLDAQFISGPISEIFDSLSEEAELDWFEFNGSYYVSSQNESTSRLLRLGQVSYDKAVNALSDAGIDQLSLEQRQVADGAAIFITGSPKLIAFSEAIIESLPEEVIDIQTRKIRVRRGSELSLESISDGAANAL